MKHISVGIVDEQPIFRAGVVHTLEHEPDMMVVGERSSASSALSFASEYLPNVLISDITNAGSNIAVLRSVVERYPEVKNCILTFCADDDQVCAALAVGAKGYVLKGATLPELAQAIRAVHRGDGYVSSSLAAATLSRVGQSRAGRDTTKHDRLTELTCREEQIFSLVASGLRNKEIGEELAITEKTVKNYITRIFEKLNVRNRVEAALVGQVTSNQSRSSPTHALHLRNV